MYTGRPIDQHYERTTVAKPQDVLVVLGSREDLERYRPASVCHVIVDCEKGKTSFGAGF